MLHLSAPKKSTGGVARGSIAKEVSDGKSESEATGNVVVPISSGNPNLWAIEFCGLDTTVFAGQSQVAARPWGLYVTRTDNQEDQIWACGSSPMPWAEGDELLGAPPKDQLVMRFNTAGKLLQLWTIPKGEDGKERPGEVNWLHAVAVDSAGNSYVGDIKGRRAQKLVRQR